MAVRAGTFPRQNQRPVFVRKLRSDSTRLRAVVHRRARGAQGRALGNLDDFDKRDLSDMSEDEDENVRRDDTSRYHFGGGFEAAEEVSEALMLGEVVSRWDKHRDRVWRCVSCSGNAMAGVNEAWEWVLSDEPA